MLCVPTLSRMSCDVLSIRIGNKYLIHFLALVVLVMPWWRWADWRVPYGCISAFIVNMVMKYWGGLLFYTYNKSWDSEHLIWLLFLITLAFWILDEYVHCIYCKSLYVRLLFAIWIYGWNHNPRLLYWIACGTRSVNYISSSVHCRVIHVLICLLHLGFSISYGLFCYCG